MLVRLGYTANQHELRFDEYQWFFAIEDALGKARKAAEMARGKRGG